MDILNLLTAYRASSGVDTSGHLFLTYHKNIQKFVKSPVGKTYLSKIPSIIAAFNKLPNPKSFTGHAFRVTSATLLADSGVSAPNIKRHGGWKSEAMVDEYVRESKKAKVDIAAAINGESTSHTPQTPHIPRSSASQPTVIYQNCNFYYN